MKKSRITPLLLASAMIIAVGGCTETQEIDSERVAFEAEINTEFELGRSRERSGVWFSSRNGDAYEFTDADYIAGLTNDIVPDEVLRTMSTAGLIETAFRYPWLTLRMNISSSSPLDGARDAFEIGVFQELYRRDDAASELVRIYNGITVDDIFRNDIHQDSPELKDGFCDIFTFRMFEYLLTQEPIMEQLTPMQRELLVKSAVSFSAERAAHGADEPMVNSTFFLFAHILRAISDDFDSWAGSNENVRHFLDSGWFMLETEEFDRIVEIASEEFVCFEIAGGVLR